MGLGLALVGAVGLMGPTAAPATACGWDWETYHAEARSLPCVYDALLGYWPKHTPEYHQTRVEAADQALRWVPGWTGGMDAKGISLMKLGRMDEAESVMKARLAIDSGAYPAHANLGTLYTFTGDHEAALTHIDTAMEIEPEAHFGREKYHRALVVFLQRVAADPSVATTENFLGITLSKNQRINGSEGTFVRLGLTDDGFDALVSMLTVYGADEVAEVYLSLGELLAARGRRRLAYTAFRRAKALGHPRTKQLRRWIKALDAAIKVETVGEIASGARRSAMPPTVRERMGDRDTYRGIGHRYASKRGDAKVFQREWAQWERDALADGLPIWTQAGLDTVYARMNEQRRRCDAPRIIGDPRAPLAADAEPTADTEPAAAPKPTANAGADKP